MLEEADNPVKTVVGDSKIIVFRDEEDGSFQYEMVSRSKYKGKTHLNVALTEWLVKLQDTLEGVLHDNDLEIHTMITRNGQIFRGHPNYRGGGPWKDWVWVDYGKDGEFPCHIWCFVVIPELGGRRIDYGGVRLSTGVFAVVESARVVDEEDSKIPLSILQPILKDVTLNEEGLQTKKNYELADTDAFVQPCCAVPDIGGPANRYYIVHPRTEWADIFVKLLHAPLDDDMVMEEDVVEEKDDKDELEEMEKASGPTKN